MFSFHKRATNSQTGFFLLLLFRLRTRQALSQQCLMLPSSKTQTLGGEPSETDRQLRIPARSERERERAAGREQAWSRAKTDFFLLIVLLSRSQHAAHSHRTHAQKDTSSKQQHTWLLDGQLCCSAHTIAHARTQSHTPAAPRTHCAGPARPAGRGSSSESGPCRLRVAPNALVCVCLPVSLGRLAACL